MGVKSPLFQITVTLMILFVTTMGAWGEQTDSETKKLEIFFSYPIFIEEGDYLSINMSGATSQLAKPGNPLLPFSSLSLPFPLGTKILDIDVFYSGEHEFSIPKKIHPMSQIVPLNGRYSTLTLFENHEIYCSNDRYPPERYSYQTTGGIDKGQHSTILTIQVYPLSYFPLSGKILYSERVVIDIDYHLPSQPFLKTQQEYDLIILSPDEFSNELNPLVEHKSKMNVSTNLVLLDEIPQKGNDEQESIKYFIKDAIENWGTRYVLLVGGMDYFPVRETHVQLPDDNEVFVTDLYYADIYNATGAFSTWDTNNNGIYGEYGWGGKTDEIDLYPDIYLGRLPCISIDEVTTTVNKIIKYEETRAYSQDWFTNIIVCGGDTAPGDRDEIDEGEYMNQKVIETMDVFNAIKIWASTDELVSASNINKAIEYGAGFLSFSGHGSPTSWATHPHEKENTWIPTGGYRTGTIRSLSNGDKLPIVITSACSTSKFNKADNCFGWSFIANPKGGAIATLGCTGLGYIYIGKSISYGLVGKMELESFKAYQEKDAGTFGELWGITINNYIKDRGRLSDSDYKTVEEWQAFGDPSLRISSVSQPPNKPSLEGPSSGRKGTTYQYRAMCTDPEEDQIFYWFDWGDGTASEWMGPYPSGLTVEASHAWENRGNYQVRVKTKDEHGSRSEWSNPLDLELSRKSLTNHYLQKGYLHVFGRPLIKTIKGNTVLIGKIVIGFNTFNTKKTIDEVSFYVDDKLCYSDIHPPFEWLWEERNQGYHTVTICPYINGHKINKNDISVWVINF